MAQQHVYETRAYVTYPAFTYHGLKYIPTTDDLVTPCHRHRSSRTGHRLPSSILCGTH